MAKKRITEYVFTAGISKDDNLFPQAYALIQANIDFIIAEEVAYIDYNIANNIPPYNGFVYDSSTCTRDVGYYLNAYLHDLRYGGNLETRNVASYLWIDGIPQISLTARSPVLATHDYIETLINTYILTNTAPPVTYSNVPQTFITGADGETGATTRISSLIDIITSVIVGGYPVIPAAVGGVSQIRLLGRYASSEILLATNTNTNEIIYNFTDPLLGGSFSYKQGKSSGGGSTGAITDLDFPRYVQTSDAITTINLTCDTSAMSSLDDIQIFVEDDVTTIRPWDFGTDAIERIRVSNPQAMLDADFEYGLQPTKWQAISLQRGYPSVYEIPGTDTSVISVVTDASAGSGGVGNSLITVTTVGPHGFTVGQPITIKALASTISGFARAEGSFLITSVPSDNTFTYYAQAKVGTTNGQVLATTYTQLRKASFYTGAAIGVPTMSVYSNGTTSTIESIGITPIGSTNIAFTGTTPTIGSPAVASGFPVGTQITGVVGSGGIALTKEVKTSTSPGATTITMIDTTNILENYAVDNGAGTVVFVTDVAGDNITLSDQLTVSTTGSTQTYTGITGTNIDSIGSGASFDVGLAGGVYTVTVAVGGEGTDYLAGDQILIVGSDVGGTDGINNITVTVVTETGGAIDSITYSGVGYTVDSIYTGLTGDSTTTVAGANFETNVVRQDGTGDYSLVVQSTGVDYVPGETITILGTNLGGATPDNDLIITIDTIDVVGGVDAYTLTGVGVTGDQSFTSISGTNVTPTGANAVFTVVRSGGAYTVTVSTAGSGYHVNSRILVLGSDVGGASPANDIVVSANTVNGSGGILTASGQGTASSGTVLTFYSTIEISEQTISIIPALTSIDVGAIPTIQVTFANNHGLLPGSGVLVNVTSNPTPAFSSASVASFGTNDWTDVAYANGKYIAVRNGGTAGALSTDLTSWTPITLSANATWTSIAAGPVVATTYYVAVASGGTVASFSTNGTSWTAATLPSSGTWSSVAYSAGVFVAVRNGSTAAARSTDGGTTWTAGGALPQNTGWSSVAGGLINGTNTFMTVSGTSSTIAAYTIDNGTTWVQTGALPATATWTSVAYGNFRFVAIASGGTSSAYSTNGITWVAGGALPASTTWRDVSFGNGVFIAVNSVNSTVAVSYDGATWVSKTVTALSGPWVALTWGQVGTADKWAVVGNTTQAEVISITPNNHNVAAGPFLVSAVPNETTIRYVARAQKSIDTTQGALVGVIYARPDSFFVHRPYDGGVQLGTGSPQHGAQAVRQSKKYIRYQSGKGMMYTTGALFAPSYSLAAGTSTGLAVNSLITFTTDDTDHGLQPGGIVEVSGFQTASYNGTYTVDSIITERIFRVRSLRALTTTTAILGNDTKITVRNWHGATVRSGPFDEQNGIFYQYDGKTLALGKRSSTFQLAGVISVNVDSNFVTGTGTRFLDQLKAGDRVVLKGMSHIVTKVISNTELTFNPDYRGVTNATLAKMCLTQDTLIPQSEWNLDRGDGTGPSGYNIDPTRMQMIGMQYTWYAAGFIEWMLRGSDGKFIFLHRIRNSNVNTEAYMRTANLPVRYEVINEGARGVLSAAMNSGQSTISLVDAFYFPETGTVYIDNELISYTGKVGNTLTGLTRAAAYGNFASGSNRTYTAGVASSHAIGTGVILISTTITPVISHWGSALLTDGQFDSDRGYMFSYASTGNAISTTKQTAFLIRLAPSVSNAIVGDLGDRELLNRAQLLLKEIAITSDAVATNTGGIVIEGVLNPQNYPTNPSDIAWGGIAGLAQGGQPSFAQIAPGGSVSWASGATQTTATATTATGINLAKTNYLYFTEASWVTIGAKVGTEVSDSKFPAGTRVTQVNGPANYVGSNAGNEYLVYFSQTSNTTINGGTTVTFTFGQPPYALPGETIFSFIANPGETASLDLSDLKELTNTTLGGRGTYPNGPDVLAINVYKTGGTATTGNIIVRWGEAQA